MTQRDNPFELTPKLQELYKIPEASFLDDLQGRNFEGAKNKWEELYEAFIKEQSKVHKRFHKGGPLHNLGIISLFLNQTEQAFKYFIFAYFEDQISKLQSGIGDPRNAPAAKTLQDSFGVQENTFEFIDKSAKSNFENRTFADPKESLKVFWDTEFDKPEIKDEIEEVSKNPLVTETPYNLDEMPGEYAKRVFIGGSYDGEYYTRLKNIKTLVRELGYEPIMVSDFKNKEGMSIRKKSLLILHNCSYAIFDVSINAGQLIEIDRSKDYEVDYILVYKYEVGKKTPWSQMIFETGKAPKPFESDEVLKRLIKDFLQ